MFIFNLNLQSLLKYDMEFKYSYYLKYSQICKKTFFCELYIEQFSYSCKIGNTE